MTGRSMTASEWGLLLMLAAVWGGSFFFNQIALRELPVFTLVLGRVGLAAAALLVICRLSAVPLPRTSRLWAMFATMAMLNNVLPFSLIVWGQRETGAALASILNATTPLFTVLVAHVATADEKLSAGKLVGVLLGLAGVAVMVGPTALGGLGAALWAQGVCLLGAVTYACAGVYGRRFAASGVPPLAAATGQVCASTVILLPLVAIMDRPWTLPLPGAETWGALAGVAALSTALGYALYFRILATAGASNLLLVTFLIPVTASLLGVSVLGETLAPRHFVGVGLIGGGLAAIDGRLWCWSTGTTPVVAQAERQWGTPRSGSR